MAIRKTLPTFADIRDAADHVVRVHLFMMWNNWDWYILSVDKGDKCYGMAVVEGADMGFFMLDELEELNHPKGFVVERDLWFMPTPLSEIRKQVQAQRG